MFPRSRSDVGCWYVGECTSQITKLRPSVKPPISISDTKGNSTMPILTYVLLQIGIRMSLSVVFVTTFICHFGVS